MTVVETHGAVDVDIDLDVYDNGTPKDRKSVVSHYTK